MAYWDLLKTTWNGTSGTNDARVAAINAMTVTGSVPTLFELPGNVLFNGINWAEFAALPAADQSLIMQACILASNLPINGGAGTMAGGLFIAKFPIIAVTGSVSGTVLTVTAGSGVAVGKVLYAVTGSPSITSLGTGTGGAGTYNLSASATVSSGSILLYPQTIANMSNIAKAIVQPWTQANGYPTPLTYGDIQTMLTQP